MKCFITIFDKNRNESKILEFENFDMDVDTGENLTPKDLICKNYTHIKIKDIKIKIKIPPVKKNGIGNFTTHSIVRNMFSFDKKLPDDETKDVYTKREKRLINKIIKR